MFGSWRIRVSVASASVVAQLVGVVAQTTDAVCLPYFDWMSNSQHLNPCAVGAGLLAVCNGGSYNVEALPDSMHYLGPVSVLNANNCQCNTVTYSLMSACAACQGRSYLPWSQWTANCPSVSSGFPEPLPIGLHVPGWAFLDPRPSDNFDQIQAQKSVNLTESVFLPPPTSTSSAAKTTRTKKSKSTSIHHSSTQKNSVPSTTITSPTPSNTSAATFNNSHANKIGGIAVGVSVAGLGIFGFIIWFIHSRLEKKKHGIQLVSPIEEKPPMDLERGPRVIVEEPGDYELEGDQIQQHDMQRYMEATIPSHSPSSATATLPSISVRTNSEPSSPVRTTHNRAT